jgi:hypothetical protein
MNTDLDLNSSVELIFRTDYVPLERLAGGGDVNRIRVNSLNPDTEAKIASDERKARRDSEDKAEATRSSDLNKTLTPAPPTLSPPKAAPTADKKPEEKKPEEKKPDPPKTDAAKAADPKADAAKTADPKAGATKTPDPKATTTKTPESARTAVKK